MRNFRLWFLFVAIISAACLSGFFITGFIAYAGIRMHLVSLTAPSSLLPFLGMFVSAAVISLSLTVVASRVFFRPIHELIQALKTVAGGNFRIRLPENARWKDIQEMNVNFNRMVKELNSIELLQSDFIQNVSHEFKTPLVAVEGYASLLSASPLPEEQKEYARRILESSQRLTALTGSILLLSKLENQQITPERHRFSLDEQIRCCILAMEPLWSQKKLDMDIDLQEIMYYGHADLLAHVWTNLLSNAVKYTPEGGTISVKLLETDARIQVLVQDTGIGMNEEVQKHIFDKFYQGEQSRSTGGNGLGLALVKRILTLCGGAIEVESQPGKGSLFTVQLPASTPDSSDSDTYPRW